MPKVDMDMTHGRILTWRVKEGQIVEKGEPLFDIETDKAAMEVESPASGMIHNLVEENVEVPIGEAIALIFGESEKSRAPAKTPDLKQVAPSHLVSVARTINSERENTVISKASPASKLAIGSFRSPVPERGKVRASPVARRIAIDTGVDLTKINGSGPKGRIMREDVEAQMATSRTLKLAATSQQASSAPALSSWLVPHKNMRRAIAKRLQESKHNSPHFYLTIDCRADDLLSCRRQINESTPSGVKVSLNDILVMAAAKALLSVPDVNASWHDAHIEKFKSANIAIAVAVPGGIVTPVIRRAEKLSLTEISTHSEKLVQLARAGELKHDDLTGGTFTISNLGMFGIREFAAIINPPQSAILAVGACEKRPMVTGDMIEITNMMTVTLSCDHRVIDGALGARWLDYFKGLIENPLAMLL